MKPRITLITLAVQDLPRAVSFYRDGLGLHTDGVVGEAFEHGAVAFFELDHGLRLALWPRASLAWDAGLPADPPSATDVCLAHNVACAEEVDAVMAEVARAGGKIVKPAHQTFWGGHAAYFQDPDGHLWEVAWNPQMLPAEPADPLPALPTIRPGRYRHYKGGEYEVVGVARHSETLEPVVIYKPLYNDSGLWVRPHAMFVGEVTVEGRRQARFAPIGP